ncbi:MAG: helix-turn-helix transcriptional regulator [Oscillospiraceae bacterium]|nr:helix-turn-helix transcriptional regulator [Oscillospiraceae bacterium]
MKIKTNALKAAMKNKGYTHEQIATHLKMSRQNFELILNNKSKSSFDVIQYKKMIKILDIKDESILFEE